MSDQWKPITESDPALGDVVWLWDGNKMWMGGRDNVDSEFWLWGNCYSTAWFNGVKWDGDIECDDDYNPTHWLALPKPPIPNPENPVHPVKA